MLKYNGNADDDGHRVITIGLFGPDDQKCFHKGKRNSKNNSN